MTVARIALILLLVVVCVQMAYFYPKIVQTVAAAQAVPSPRGGMLASHFNAAGEPNGQQTISQFFTTYITIIVLEVVLFFGAPAALRYVPSEFINLPNRDYWLAPERREQTLADLNTRFNWLGVATVSLVLVVMQWVLTANLSGDPHLPGFAVWIPLGAYLAFSIWWIGRLAAAFRRPE
ncbi:MAG TPA: hypothetical protein VIX35_06285 [Vicinamibacterales bacterium]